MKTIAKSALVGFLLCFACEAKEVTLVVNTEPVSGPTNTSDEIVIGTNESATVTSALGGPNGYTHFYIIKNGVTNGLRAMDISGGGSSIGRPVTVAGPATMRLVNTQTMNQETFFCTVKIEPESFPPGLTIILPEGTVGVIHVESSTNLIQWADEWVHTFANTNENRFFRLRAERSLP